MPLAITLRLDPVANARVEAMVVTLTERLPDAYPPHITLAVLSDIVDAMELARVLSAKVLEWPALEVTFAGFGVFPTEPAALWLAPAPTKLLLELHRLVSALVGVDSVHRHYRPDAWMPHDAAGRRTSRPMARLTRSACCLPTGRRYQLSWDAWIWSGSSPSESSGMDRWLQQTRAARFTVNARMIVL